MVSDDDAGSGPPQGDNLATALAHQKKTRELVNGIKSYVNKAQSSIAFSDKPDQEKQSDTDKFLESVAYTIALAGVPRWALDSSVRGYAKIHNEIETDTFKSQRLHEMISELYGHLCNTVPGTAGDLMTSFLSEVANALPRMCALNSSQPPPFQNNSGRGRGRGRGGRGRSRPPVNNRQKGRGNKQPPPTGSNRNKGGAKPLPKSSKLNVAWHATEEFRLWKIHKTTTHRQAILDAYPEDAVKISAAKSLKGWNLADDHQWVLRNQELMNAAIQRKKAMVDDVSNDLRSMPPPLTLPQEFEGAPEAVKADWWRQKQPDANLLSKKAKKDIAAYLTITLIPTRDLTTGDMTFQKSFAYINEEIEADVAEYRKDASLETQEKKKEDPP